MQADALTGHATAAEINFGWLVRLRWSTIAGQLLTIAVVRWGMRLPIAMQPLGLLVAIAIAVNVISIVCSRRTPPHEWWLFAAMTVDVLVFTGLLYFTGGPLNPFSFLYLVPIALAAITLRPGWTWALVTVSLASSAFLFASHRPLPLAGDHARHMAMHLRGMWIAFGVGAAFIVHFLLRVRRSLAERDEELATSRNLAARQERLASLATLAAGAAHELSTPLSTIAVVAKDLEREAQIAPSIAEDVALMRQEVERCRRILERMRVDAGESTGERFTPVVVRDLVNDCVNPTPMNAAGARKVVVTVAEDAAPLSTVVPPRAFRQALRGLVENACQASPPGAAVSVNVTRDHGRRVIFEVADQGPGMPPDVLARVGEPFFTTKPAGRGMGLGVFLARAIAERLGGELAIRSALGVGTTATLSLPEGGSER